MKSFTLLLLMTVSTFAVAQETVPQDTTIYLKGRRMVVQERDGKIKVNLYENSNDNTLKNTQVFEGVYLEGRSVERTTTFSLPFDKKKEHRARFDPHYPSFYFGFNRMATAPMRYNARVPQLYTKSWEWGLNLYNTGISISNNNHWGLTSTLGVARVVYKLDNNLGFERVGDATVCIPAPDKIEYSKSWLRYWAFRLPVSVEWQTYVGSRRFFMAAGAEGEWRTGVTSRAKYNGHKHVLSDKLNANPLGVNLLLQAGYGEVGIQARFTLTPLFDKHRAPEIYPASIGIGFYW
ncbi:MAG: hypothetical protein LBM62_00945 [Mediterranea sp.]|jgi:hypothetical protein|nr:hypothetical protein [Mediterranea sp.]